MSALIKIKTGTVLVLALLLGGCHGAATTQPPVRYIAQPSAYDAALTVWLWADAQVSAERRAAEGIVLDATRSLIPTLQEHCGDSWRECGLQAFTSMLAEWEQANDYRARSQRITRARTLLDRWAKVKDSPASSGSGGAMQVASLLTAIVDELSERKVEIPREIRDALAQLYAIGDHAKHASLTDRTVVSSATFRRPEWEIVQ